MATGVDMDLSRGAMYYNCTNGCIFYEETGLLHIIHLPHHVALLEVLNDFDHRYLL